MGSSSNMADAFLGYSGISDELKAFYKTAGTGGGVDFDGFNAYQKSFNAYQAARRKYPLGAEIEDMGTDHV